MLQFLQRGELFFQSFSNYCNHGAIEGAAAAATVAATAAAKGVVGAPLCPLRKCTIVPLPQSPIMLLQHASGSLNLIHPGSLMYQYD